MKERLSIYLVYHADLPTVESSLLLPIRAGAEGNGDSEVGLHDAVGDHISDKNRTYSEMTAQYWVWKNVREKSDCIGFCHYRRRFLGDIGNRGAGLRQEEVITPRALKLSRSIRRQYLASHWSLPWEVMMAVLREKTPEYHQTALECFRGNTLYPFNIFIMRREQFEAYMTWIFGILFEMEKRIPPRELSDYQSRYLGFISERLFTLYLAHHRLRVIEVPIKGGRRDLLTHQGVYHKVTAEALYHLRRK